MDPLSGAEIEAAAAIITGSEYATPTLKFVMVQLAEPAKTATLTFEGALDVPRCAFVTMYDGGAKLVSEAIDPWPAGYYGAQDHYDNSALICRPLTFMRAAPSEHGYARPVEGLIVTFDLDKMEVTDVEDFGVVPLPPTAGNYDPRFMFDEHNRPAFFRNLVHLMVGPIFLVNEVVKARRIPADAPGTHP